MTEALIGLVGLLIGLLINEHFRRINRIEKYSTRVFDRRIEIYEGLLHLVQEKSSFVTKVIESADLTKEETHNLCQSAGLKVMEYCDANQLYLNEEIIVHIGASFISVSDIIDSNNEVYRRSEIQNFNKSIKDAKQMITSEAGLEELNLLFQKITKAKHTSPIIEYFRKLKRSNI